MRKGKRLYSRISTSGNGIDIYAIKNPNKVLVVPVREWKSDEEDATIEDIENYEHLIRR